MIDYSDELKRITLIISLINSYDPEDDPDGADLSEITIRKIAARLGNSLRQTREDVAALSIIGVCFGDDQKDIRKLSGKTSAYDDEPLLYIPLSQNPPEEEYDLFLSPTARRMYKRRSLDQINILVKDSPIFPSSNDWKKSRDVQNEIDEKIRVIQGAIAGKHEIQFLYQGPKDERALIIRIFPRLIYHNRSNNRVYCITLDGDEKILPYRIDRIHSGVKVYRTNPKKVPKDGDAKLKLIEYIWGGDFGNFSEIDKPVHVVLQIREGTKNIIRKIKADTCDRKYGSLKKTGFDGTYNIWTYEDDILGRNAFLAWLRSYGSAIRVLAPKDMADSILETARRSRINYEQGRFVEDPEYDPLI